MKNGQDFNHHFHKRIWRKRLNETYRHWMSGEGNFVANITQAIKAMCSACSIPTSKKFKTPSLITTYKETICYSNGMSAPTNSMDDSGQHIQSISKPITFTTTSLCVIAKATIANLLCWFFEVNRVLGCLWSSSVCLRNFTSAKVWWFSEHS